MSKGNKCDLSIIDIKVIFNIYNNWDNDWYWWLILYKFWLDLYEFVI